MPLEIERHRSRESTRERTAGDSASGSLVIGLVNNMPDSALEATESQFGRLLSAAAASSEVRLRLSFLPEVPRAQAGLEHIQGAGYWPIDALLHAGVDGLIVTGMEPCKPLLSEEPYWGRMSELVRWAQSNTGSSIWSCLAAHAAVEYLDGIRRRRLERKRCGVFAHTIVPEEALLAGVAAPLHIPHSRWNELPVDALAHAGYRIASFSPETGADMFIKDTSMNKGGSLFIFFQGHPEYEEATLLREYRRDVGRFLRGQQPHYPTLPDGYFSPQALELLSAFQERALAASSADLLAEFPMTPVADTLRNTWGNSAAAIYRNWLALLASARKRTGTRAAAAGILIWLMSEPQNNASDIASRERVIGLIERILERAPGAAPLPTTARLNELGMSSMKMINLMLAIEVEFDLTIPQADITPENFDSIASVDALVTRLLKSGSGQGS
jgi:homoserine O-succinyltransferase